ncbi:MAG: response regulator transcription factor [Gaiellaceae bacterium]
MTTARPTVLLVDDNDAFRESLREHLLDDGRVEVVGEARNGEAALGRILALRPQFVSLDLDMPVMNGFETAAAIRDHHPDVTVIVVSGSSVAKDRDQLEALGVAGLLSKQRAFADLVDEILGLRPPAPAPQG